MAISVHHVHLKTTDPKKTMQFYVDTLDAKLIKEVDGRGYQVNLHGLQLNITTIIDTQKREQKLGIEHIAIDTDDYAGTMAKFRATGARVLEEMIGSSGRHVGWVEAPDGAQIEVIEKA